MRYTNEYDNDKDSIDIYSMTRYEDISSSSKPRSHRKKKSKGKRFLKAIAITLICLIAIGVGGYMAAVKWLIPSYIEEHINQEPLEYEKPEELHINTSLYADVQNIALFGIDSRQDNSSGRSDAVIILTIDKIHNKIKLTSIARDSYVEMDGRGHDKLTHAYAFGKSTLAVKTLNKNFDLEITDYVTVNFYEFSRIIDYIGGVTIDVNKKEKDHLNSYIFPLLRKQTSLKCDDISKTGKQTLDGTQALCYSRIRKIDGDIERGNRQKEVLEAMFKKVKDTSITKLPKVVEMVLSECTTSMSSQDITDIGMWAITSQPQMENISIPNDVVKGKGKTIRGVWYYVYDIDAAKEEMKKFILETQPEPTQPPQQ